jgi:hypothetical protein
VFFRFLTPEHGSHYSRRIFTRLDTCSPLSTRARTVGNGRRACIA